MDWEGLMRVGILGLRLPPETFWDLTPAELQMLLGSGGSGSPLLSGGLENLMQAWPDMKEGVHRE